MTMIKKWFLFLKKIFKAYWVLSKGGIVFLVVISAAMGYFVQGGRFTEKLFLSVMISTSLVCAGAGAFNHLLETSVDKTMKRTQNRPLVMGHISKWHGFIFALVVSVLGLWMMWEKVSILMMVGGATTMGLYLFMYTPLKQKTKYNTLIGAIPGALPVLGGGVASATTLNEMKISGSVWLLFALVYCWQHPHFHAIAWLCQKDYQNSRFKMLSNDDEKLMFFHMIFFTFCTFLLSMLLFLTEQLSFFYFILAFILGVYFLYITLKVIEKRHKKENAKKVLWASIVYIPLLFAFLVLDQVYLSL